MQIEQLSLNNFFLFLIFFIPSFISVKIYDLFIPSEKKAFSKSSAFTIGSLSFSDMKIVNYHNGWVYVLFALYLFLNSYIINFI